MSIITLTQALRAADQAAGNPYRPLTEYARQARAFKNPNELGAVSESVRLLAHEQRTANLIALYVSGTVQHQEASFGMTAQAGARLLAEITERLGLDEVSA